MRILSKFKDYYDFVVTEPDNKKMYVRDTKKVVFTEYEYKDSPETTILSKDSSKDLYHANGKTSYYNSKDYSDGFVGVIAFCDRLHHYFHYKNLIYWKYDDIPDDVIKKITPTNSFWRWQQKKYEDRMWKNSMDDMLHYKKLDWIVNRHSKEPIKTNINKQLDSPIVFIGSPDYRDITVNPNLTTLGFNKILSPTEAYQDIYNWIPYKEPDVPSSPDDMNRYEAKGFDKKTSFRPNMK